MKKTIIALLALAGVASAASSLVGPAALELQITDASLDWVYAGTTTVAKNVTSTNATLSDGTFTTNGTNQIGDALGTVGAPGTPEQYTPLVTGVGMNTFALTFTADWTKNESGPSMLMSWGEGGNWGFGFGVNADGNWEVIQGQYNKPVTVNTSGIAAVDGGAQTYTIIGQMEQIGDKVWDGATNQTKGTYHVNVYEGDTLVYSASYGTEADRIGFGTTFNPRIYFGAGVNGANATVMTVSQATLHVPEPATATLSLLALAGLCARRRRA